jgi:diguanylate cyclase (GGDEF)-like protein
MLRRQATFDALTDLPNRMLLLERLEKAIDSARGTKGITALLVMDLDRFKEINDTFGHQFGDMLLKQIAVRLRHLLAPNETLSRLGGDEFGLFLTRASDANDVAAVARRVLDSLLQPFAIEGQIPEASASIGIARSDTARTRACCCARRCCDVRRERSERGYAFHNQEHESRTEQLALIVEMGRWSAMSSSLLQPKLHLSSGLMTRGSAHPMESSAARLLAPAAFIPIAERTGLIKPITDWVIDRRSSSAVMADTGAPVHVALNLSAQPV